MIFYFSATGNSLWAAHSIAQATGERLISMADKRNQGLQQLKVGEKIGFVFPVHGWRPPQLVRSFISTLQFSQHADESYCYALLTAGDDVGLTIDYLNQSLATCGLHTHAAFSLLMPETYVGLPFMNTDTPEAEKKKRAEAEQLLAKHIQRIVQQEEGATDLHLSHWPRVNSHVLGSLFEKKIITDKPFRVDIDRCTRCGICATACPTGDLVGGKEIIPQWQHNGSCISCFACYHYCPHHAIAYGNRTKNKGQYHFPGKPASSYRDGE